MKWVMEPKSNKNLNLNHYLTNWDIYTFESSFDEEKNRKNTVSLRYTEKIGSYSHPSLRLIIIYQLTHKRDVFQREARCFFLG